MKHFFFKHSLLIAIVLLALALRLYRIDNEPMDWHAFRQSDSASVTREYIKNGIDLLRPEYHDLSNIQSGKENPEGYRMVEFPFINAGIATLLRVFPSMDLSVTSRLTSVFFSLGTLLSLFFLVQHLSGKKLAYLSVFVFGTLPFSVFYGRAILPEAPLLFFTTFALLAFAYWLRKKSSAWFFISAASLALAFLLKPFAVFLAGAFALLLWHERKKAALRLWPWLLLYGAVVLAPFFAWRNWILNFPTGIPASDWLFNGNGIRLRPAWFRWLGYERGIKLILGYTSSIFIFPSFVQKTKGKAIYHAWAGGIITYFIVIATGNVQHDYYQALAIPILSIFIAEGMLWLFKQIQKHSKGLLSFTYKKQPFIAPLSNGIGLATVTTIYVTGTFFSWQQISGYFNINHYEYQRAGHAVDTLTPKDAKVIAPALGDTQFLFQTNRRGWPIGFSIDEKIAQGATHYVTTTFDDEARELEERFMVVQKTDEFLILDLRKERPQL